MPEPAPSTPPPSELKQRKGAALTDEPRNNGDPHSFALGQLAGRVEGLTDTVGRLVDTQAGLDTRLIERLEPRFKSHEVRFGKLEAFMEDMKRRWWMLAGGIVALSLIAKYVLHWS